MIDLSNLKNIFLFIVIICIAIIILFLFGGNYGILFSGAAESTIPTPEPTNSAEKTEIKSADYGQGRLKLSILSKMKQNNTNVLTYDIAPEILLYFTTKETRNKVIRSKLKITHQGTYSITSPGIALKIARYIEKIGQNIHSIVDATACMGGDTIAFAQIFDDVYAVEIDPINFDALSSNIEAFKFVLSSKPQMANIKLYNEDYLTIMDKLSADAVFIDPPWMANDILLPQENLALGDQTLSAIINKLGGREINKPLIVALKVPPTFNEHILSAEIVSPHKIYVKEFKKMKLIIVKFITN